ncbi:hypothetical protein VTI74DRAFT_7427 [Chaetomium olivicolor]
MTAEAPRACNQQLVLPASDKLLLGCHGAPSLCISSSTPGSAFQALRICLRRKNLTVICPSREAVVLNLVQTSLSVFSF